ncbi:M48 family metallopeptidase [Bernardetia sp. Wsw4-3y2]|uniref:M48 family metallopeptidase n=1 Tax=Bernardetia sp. Wsw4-3y2 TaxID=3127471 RepID=UPI0030CF4D22
MKKISYLSFIVLFYFVTACATAPLTGRKQLILLPASEINSMSFQAYNEMLNEQQVVKGTTDAQTITNVGQRIQYAVETYLKSVNKTDLIKGFQWEYNLVQEPSANASCMPGGKVIFHTGIMPICQTPTGVGVVMGHEVAHAVASHGNERMSQGMAAQGVLSLGSALMNQKPTLGKQLILQAAGLGTQVGLLKFSRDQESEADHLGIIFMAMAGYNPAESIAFWQRMSAQAAGQAPPEFLSTHPSSSTRINNLKKWLPEAMKYYNASPYKGKP